MWSVRTMPCLVFTVLPSTIGRRSRCTPSRRRRAGDALAAGDLVDLVDEDDARLLDPADRLARHLIHVEELARFLLAEVLERFAHRRVLGLGLTGEEIGEGVLELKRHFFHALRRHDLDERGRRLADLDVDLALVELALAQHAAELVAGAGRLGRDWRGGVAHRLDAPLDAGRRQQEVEHALLGALARPRPGPSPSPPRAPCRWRARRGRG
jgi:hypothetical protein